MRSVKVTFGSYVFVVLAAGLAFLAYLNTTVTDPPSELASPSSLILWMAMIAVAALSPIPLPRGTATFSLTPAFDLAALLLFGPANACWIGVLSRVFTNVAERWNPLFPAILKLGQSLLSIGAGGLVFVALGGETGLDLTLSGDQLRPLAAACATYVLVKWLIGLVGEVLQATKFHLRVAGAYLGQTVASDIALLPFGLLLALTQVRIGPAGVALFLIPLLLARYSFRQWGEAKRAYVDMVRILMAAVDATDPHTRGHSYRISKISLRVGRQLGMPESELEELEFAALLHDIGRTAIRHEILVKPGRLTEQEQSQLRTHPTIGREILSTLRFFSGAAEIVYAHHEQPDGKGYPRGLKAAEIPLGSRIIMVVAAFDAMTSDRPYRPGLPPDAAFEELLAHGGTQFFPEVVETLIRLYASGTLFDDFDEKHMAAGEDCIGTSRAVAEHLKRTRAQGGVPEKRGLVGAKPAATTSPSVLEFPMAEVERVAEEKVVPLKGRGGKVLFVAASSDVGCTRKNNEDAFGIYECDEGSRGCLLILSDGMGGAAAGEVASHLAVEIAHRTYQGGKRMAAKDALPEAVRVANRAVHERAAGDASLTGMGATCTAAAVVGRDLFLAHVGDSRAYLVLPGTIERLTRDHTLAAELEMLAAGGALPADAAHASAASHVLTRALGTAPDVQVDGAARPIRLEDGATLVLCSDGLTGVIEDEQIFEVVSQEDPREACRKLVEMARHEGGPDNITVIVARVQSSRN